MEKQLDIFGQEVGLKEIKRTKREVFEDYNSFVDKFEVAKTTDDCYTPKAVYDAVVEFVGSFYDLTGKTIVRPFFPGGDFENFEYPENCVVIDNPPFSIMSKIVRFYDAHRIPFFIFAPALTLFSAPNTDVTYVICGASVVYENKAVVSTSFITNLCPDLRIWVAPQLTEAIKAACAEPDNTKQKFVYPNHILTAATIQKLAHHGTELKVRKESCEYIRDSDVARDNGRNLFGGGFLLSERAAAERAAATKLGLSAREWRIVERLL